MKTMISMKNSKTKYIDRKVFEVAMRVFEVVKGYVNNEVVIG